MEYEREVEEKAQNKRGDTVRLWIVEDSEEVIHEYGVILSSDFNYTVILRFDNEDDARKAYEVLQLGSYFDID